MKIKRITDAPTHMNVENANSIITSEQLAKEMASMKMKKTKELSEERGMGGSISKLKGGSAQRFDPAYNAYKNPNYKNLSKNEFENLELFRNKKGELKQYDWRDDPKYKYIRPFREFTQDKGDGTSTAYAITEIVFEPFKHSYVDEESGETKSVEQRIPMVNFVKYFVSRLGKTFNGMHEMSVHNFYNMVKGMKVSSVDEDAIDEIVAGKLDNDSDYKELEEQEYEAWLKEVEEGIKERKQNEIDLMKGIKRGKVNEDIVGKVGEYEDKGYDESDFATDYASSHSYMNDSALDEVRELIKEACEFIGYDADETEDFLATYDEGDCKFVLGSLKWDLEVNIEQGVEEEQSRDLLSRVSQAFAQC